jgi:hypothetical protein
MAEQREIYGSNLVNGVVLIKKNTIPYSLIKNLDDENKEFAMPAIFNVGKDPIYYYSLERLKQILNTIKNCIKPEDKITHDKLKEHYKKCSLGKQDLTTESLLMKMPMVGKQHDLLSKIHFENFQNNLAYFFEENGEIMNRRFVATNQKITALWCPTDYKKVGNKHIMTQYGYITKKKVSKTSDMAFTIIVNKLKLSMDASGNCVLGKENALEIYNNVNFLLKKKHHSSFIKETVQDLLLDEEDDDDNGIEEKCRNAFFVLVGLAKVASSPIKYSFEKSNAQHGQYVQLMPDEKISSVIRTKLHAWNEQFADFHLDISTTDLRGGDTTVKMWYFFIVEQLLFKMLMDLNSLNDAEIVKKMEMIQKYKDKIKALVENNFKKTNRDTYLKLIKTYKGQTEITDWPISPSNAFPFQSKPEQKLKYLLNKKLQKKSDKIILNTLAMHYKYFLELKKAPNVDDGNAAISEYSDVDDGNAAISEYNDVVDDNGKNSVKLLSNFYRPYPSIQDKDFYKKLHAKKEFRQSGKREKTAADADKCKKPGQNVFQMSPQQQWVANYLSTGTPYNSLLLYWGTGVGKTCASISICEQNLAYYKQNNKKILVIATVGTMENFKKELFNDAKDLEEQKGNLPPGSLQCSGNRYYIAPRKGRGQEALRKQTIMAKINEDYEFIAHTSIKSKFNELLHAVNLDADKLLDKTPLSKKQLKMAHNVISSYFSGRLIVIDEIQNIRDDAADGKTQSKTAQLLESILTNSENIKLVLMTATPMYDKATEIVYLLNLMLINDKRPTINETYFFRNGNFKSNKQSEFMALLRGYVSYVRGNNPETFPKRLAPEPEPQIGLETYTPANMATEELENQAKNFSFVKCELSASQKKCLEGYDSSKVLSGIPTICCFMANNGKSAADKSNFDTLKKLQEFSPKMSLLVKFIRNEKSGIIFISANYLAIAETVANVLSYYGMKPYHKEAPRLARSSDEKKHILQGNYAYLGTTMDVVQRQMLIDQVINTPENISGSLIRVIIGTSVMDEGVDLKNVRQIHILSPWYNFSRLDQIIGRGIRHCSHQALKEQDQNATVYMYCSTNSKREGNEDDDFTSDERLYKLSLTKDIEIKKVELMLRNAAVDCITNKKTNRYQNEADNTRDSAYTKWEKYSCAGGEAVAAAAAVNTNTYQPLLHSKDTINRYKNAIKALFKQQFSYSLLRLTQLVLTRGKPTPEEKQNLYDALTLLFEHQSLRDKHDRLGRLVFHEGFYHFQPAYLDHVGNLPDYYRRTKAPDAPKKAFLAFNANAANNNSATTTTKTAVAPAAANTSDKTLDLVYEDFAKMYITEDLETVKKLNKDETYVAYANEILKEKNNSGRVKLKANISFFMDRLKNKLVQKLIPDVLNKCKNTKTGNTDKDMNIYKVMKEYIQSKTSKTNKLVVEWSSLAHFHFKEEDNKYHVKIPPAIEMINDKQPYGMLEVVKITVNDTNQTIQENIKLRILNYTESKVGIMCSSIPAKRGVKKFNKVGLYELITSDKLDEKLPNGKVMSINDKQIELALREKNRIF